MIYIEDDLRMCIDMYHTLVPVNAGNSGPCYCQIIPDDSKAKSFQNAMHNILKTIGFWRE